MNVEDCRVAEIQFVMVVEHIHSNYRRLSIYPCHYPRGTNRIPLSPPHLKLSFPLKIPLDADKRSTQGSDSFVLHVCL